jgi:hypothetical protein
MPAYDAIWFDPPAPLARVSIRGKLMACERKLHHAVASG